MNKFAAFAILALAALAVSVSSSPIVDLDDETMTQAILNTSDDEETAQLANKNMQVFGDFCVSSRDFVLADLKSKTGGLSSKIFGLFFSSAEAIGQESLEVQNKATEKLANQLAHPESPIEEAQDGIDEIVAEGQAQIQGQSQPRALLTAFKTAVTAVSSKVGGLVTDRLNYLKSFATPEQLVNGISAGCDQIAVYEGQIREQFEEYKKSSLGADAAKYASIQLDAVPCATSSKIIRSEGLCGLVRVVQKPLKKIFATRA